VRTASPPLPGEFSEVVFVSGAIGDAGDAAVVIKRLQRLHLRLLLKPPSIQRVEVGVDVRLGATLGIIIPGLFDCETPGFVI
jgi:hypothetical protein